MEQRLIRMPEVLKKVGLKKSAIYARIKSGQFPKPVKLGSASVWPEGEIHIWIEKQVSGAKMVAN